MLRSIAGVILTGVAFAHPVLAAQSSRLTSKQLKSIEEFEVSKEPAKRDWQAFHKADPSFRSALWTYHQKRQVAFSSWSWGWRMGWVRSCSADPKGYCAKILETALFDKALVVRSEAATQIGRIFESTKNEKFSALLIKAFNNPKNFRKKKPLFIQQRILFALHQIGNSEAAITGKKMAGANRDLSVYWSKITKI